MPTYRASLLSIWHNFTLVYMLKLFLELWTREIVALFLCFDILCLESLTIDNKYFEHFPQIIYRIRIKYSYIPNFNFLLFKIISNKCGSIFFIKKFFLINYFVKIIIKNNFKIIEKCKIEI